MVYAAGVAKTYQMLRNARELKARGCFCGRRLRVLEPQGVVVI